MRTGLVIDRSLRGADIISIDRRNRVTGLILELAQTVHATGLIRDHADPTDHSGWNVKNIETCGDPLCVDALAAIRDIENVSREFPTEH